jgi:hypothetical protein
MAHRTELRRQARRVRNLLRSYAQQHGWSEQDYRIFMRARRGGFLHVLLVARAWNGPAGFTPWELAWEYLKDGLRDEPEVLDHLRLGVRSFDQVAEGGPYAITPDYAELN